MQIFSNTFLQMCELLWFRDSRSWCTKKLKSVTDFAVWRINLSMTYQPEYDLGSICHNLFIFFTFRFLPLFYGFQVHPMPLRHFSKKTVKFWRGSIFFCKVFILKMFLCLIFHKKFLPVNMKLLLTVKIFPDVNNYLLLVHDVQEFSAC